jgi:hypothetical protein
VSRSSVKNYLARGCKRRRPVLERMGHGPLPAHRLMTACWASNRLSPAPLTTVL